MQYHYKKEPSITWLDRSEIAAHFIRAGDAVCDLGAGAQTLRRFLPPSVAYYPVDRFQHHADTWLSDFNGDFTLPDKPFNVLTCIGVLTHLADAERFLRRLAGMHGGAFIIVTDDMRKMPPDFYGHIRHLNMVAQMRKTYIFTGVLDDGSEGPESHRKPLHDIILANTPAGRYVRRRISLAVRLVRRGGNSG